MDSPKSPATANRQDRLPESQPTTAGLNATPLPAPMAAPCPTPSASPGHVIPVDELVLSSLANDASAGDQIVLSVNEHQPRIAPATDLRRARIVGGAAARDKMDGTRLPTPYPRPRCVSNRLKRGDDCRNVFRATRPFPRPPASPKWPSGP
jgi:hypothetical protein